MEEKQMISIETKRLHLRNVSQNDVQAMFDYRNNEICARYQRGQIKDFKEIQNLIEKTLIDDTGEYENNIYIEGVSYYLTIKLDNFKGNIDIISEQEKMIWKV